MTEMWECQPYKMIYSVKIRFTDYSGEFYYAVVGLGCNPEIAFKNAMREEQKIMDKLTYYAVRRSISKHKNKNRKGV